MGIVAEYNLLHLGHLHHITRARQISGADGVVAVLSSYFTQRGEPSVLSKWDRAETALLAGVNLVLELPVFFSCSNAGVFASGAVDILAASGIVDYLSFGMETPDFDTSPILDILDHEPRAFKENLKKHLASGCSYVRARASALGEVDCRYGEFISRPNNALALAYMERIRKRNYPVKCLPVQRMGAGYGETELSSPFPSASGIRKCLREEGLARAERFLPRTTAAVLRKCVGEGRAVLSQDMLWRMLRPLLLRTAKEELASYSGMTEGMEGRFLRFAGGSSTWEEFVGRCVTKRYPRGRIQRQLIHFLLGLGEEENRRLQSSGPAYIRVLAADGKGLEILRRARDRSSLPLLGRHPHSCEKGAGRIAHMELTAGDAWESLAACFRPGEERKRRPLITQGRAEGESAP